MFGKAKTNFNDRLRRLGCDQLHKQLKHKQKSKTTIDNFIPEFDPEEKSPEMLADMRR